MTTQRIFIGIALAIAGTAWAANLYVPVDDLLQQDVAVRRVTLTSTDGPRNSGAALITVEPKSQFTSATGETTFTNVLYGNYRLDISGSPGTRFEITVPDTNTTVNVTTLIGAATPPNPATNYWTSAQVQAYIDAGLTPTFDNDNRWTFDDQ